MANTAAATDRNYPGEAWPHTPGSAVAAGEIVRLGGAADATDMVGYAQDAIAAGELGTVYVSGVHTLIKPTATAGFTQGLHVYFDGTDLNLSSTGNAYVGRIAETAGTNDVTCQVAIGQA